MGEAAVETGREVVEVERELVEVMEVGAAVREEEVV